LKFSESGRLKVGGEIRTILGARVGRVGAERIKLAARVLPDVAALIPVEAHGPKQSRQIWLPRGRDIEPNPIADNLGNFVLPREPRSQVVQNGFGGQPAVGAMPDKVRLFIPCF
jgi:hypothetical protein